MLEGLQAFFQTVVRQYHQALVIYKFTLVCAFAIEGHDSLEVAALFNNLTGVYDRPGQYERALEYYQKDLDFTVRLVGGDHLDVAKFYNGRPSPFRHANSFVLGTAVINTHTCDASRQDHRGRWLASRRRPQASTRRRWKRFVCPRANKNAKSRMGTRALAEETKKGQTESV